jgi:hypothetical protein
VTHLGGRKAIQIGGCRNTFWVPVIPTPATCLVPVRRPQVEPLQVEPVFPVNPMLETGGSFLGTHFIPIKYQFVTKVYENITQLLCILYIQLLSKIISLNAKVKHVKYLQYSVTHVAKFGDTCHKILPAEFLHLRQFRRAGCTG